MRRFSLLVTSLLLTLFFACQNENPAATPLVEKTKEMIQWLDFSGKETLKKNKRIVLISGDEEYRSEEALPQLAKILANRHGFDCTVLFAQNPKKPGIVNPNYTKNIPGLEALENADLMILFTRFRALPDQQMKYIENYLNQGKPVIGIRTATHAFVFGDTISAYHHWGNYYKGEKSEWLGGFGQRVLGVNWHTHHGHHKNQSTRGVFAKSALPHPILRGIEDGSIWGATDVYGAPIPKSAEAIVYGQVVNRAGAFDKDDIHFGMRETDKEIATTNPANKNGLHPNDPMMPIVWSKSYQLDSGKKGRAITSTIGASADLLDEDLRRLFVNSVYYLLDLLPLTEKVNVDLVGKYQPSAYSFYTNEYWILKETKVSDFVE